MNCLSAKEKAPVARHMSRI